MAISLTHLIYQLKAKPAAGGWLAHCICPGHTDSNPSLFISEGDTKDIVWFCRAGCDQDVLTAEIHKLDNGAPSGFWYTRELLAQHEKNLAQAEKFLTSRGISMDTARKFHFGFDPSKGTGMGELVIPTFDANGDLCAIKRRDLNPEVASKDKWKKHNRDKGVYHLFNRAAALDACFVDDLYITESEIDAVMLEGMGLHAVSIDSAGHKFNAEDAALLKEFSGTICAAHDTDGPGETGLARHAEELKPKGMLRIKPDQKDLGDLYAANPEGFAQALADLRAAAAPVKGVQTPAPETPLPLNPPAETDNWPPPIPLADFYGPLGDFVRELEPETEADANALYVQALAVVGNIIGKNAFCLVRDSRHYPNLFVGIVGPTAGARKGTGGDSVQALGQEIDGEWFKESIASGIASGEFIVERVKDTPEETEKQKDPALIIDGNPAVVKRLTVFEEELGFLLSSAKRESSTTAAVLRGAWDGKRLQVGAKNVGAIATNAHVSLIGHITAEELLTLLSESMIKGGLVNRFLWICSKRSKLLPEGGNPIDYAPIAKRINRALAGMGRRLRIERDQEARELWDSIYRETESQAREGLYGKATCRAAAQILRLSLIFALLDGETVIRVPHLEAARAVWRYSEASARFIFPANFTGNAETERILGALKNSIDGKTQTEISELFGRNKSADVIAGLLSTLIRAGKVKYRDEETGGRMRRLWELA